MHCLRVFSGQAMGKRLRPLHAVLAVKRWSNVAWEGLGRVVKGARRDGRSHEAVVEEGLVGFRAKR